MKGQECPREERDDNCEIDELRARDLYDFVKPVIQEPRLGYDSVSYGSVFRTTWVSAAHSILRLAPGAQRISNTWSILE